MARPETSILSSSANPTVRRLIRLRDNRFRRRAQRVIVDGWRETQRALDGGLQCCRLYAVDGDPLPDDAHAVLKLAEQENLLQCVTAEIMGKISYGQSGRGVVSEFVQPTSGLDDLKLPAEPLIFVLDRIQKPGNLGAVFRCADAAGIDAVILCDCESDRFNPNAIRSSLGTVFSVPSANASLAETAAFLLQSKIRPLAARVESSSELWACDWNGPRAIILGSEALGLGDRWRSLPATSHASDQQACQQPIAGIRIPMAGQADSLNISISAAVIAYEATRVRRNRS